jgi:hypothetical protein
MSRRVFAKNLIEAQRMAIEDFEYDMKAKYGDYLRFKVEEAPSMMAKGGEIVVKNPRFPYTEGYFKTTKEANEFILRQSKYRNVSGWNIQEVKKSSNKPKMEQGGKMAKGGRLSRKQKQLDLNKNGKLDSQDFKMLRAGRKNTRKK